MQRLMRVADELARRVYRRLRPYLGPVKVHDLPCIHHYWAGKYLAPRARAVIGFDNVADIYAGHFRERLAGGGPRRIVSIGAGDCAIEIEVARRLVELGVDRFRFDCLELSPRRLRQAAEAVRRAGLEGHFQLVECDLNRDFPAETCLCAMAHHALHHVAGLERLFDRLRATLAPEGVFVSCDMIGRNGHMRWPEALEVLEPLWRTLPDRLKRNHHSLFRRVDRGFYNRDCAAGGHHEGVRAQDVLPLLVERFAFEKFLAFGNLPDVFLERAYGPNLDPRREEDRALIDRLETQNELLIDCGRLKPTQMIAVMGLRPSTTRVYRHWTPRFCIRPASGLVAPAAGRSVSALPLDAALPDKPAVAPASHN